MSNIHSDWAAYVWWVKFLQLSDRSTWTPEVAADFSSALGSDPEQWAIANRQLWSGPLKPTRPMYYRDGTEQLPEHLVVVIDVTAPDDKIRQRLDTLIRLHREEIGFERTAGRPRWEQRHGKWRLAARPNIEVLAAAHHAWVLRQENEGEPLWKLGEVLARSHTLATKVRLAPDSVDRRKRLSQLFSRYWGIAQENVRSVAGGVFPARP